MRGSPSYGDIGSTEYPAPTSATDASSRRLSFPPDRSRPFENGALAFERKNAAAEQPHLRTIAAPQEELPRENEVVAELLAEHIQLKRVWGTLASVRLSRQVRDAIGANYDKSELHRHILESARDGPQRLGPDDRDGVGAGSPWIARRCDAARGDLRDVQDGTIRIATTEVEQQATRPTSLMP